MGTIRLNNTQRQIIALLQNGCRLYRILDTYWYVKSPSGSGDRHLSSYESNQAVRLLKREIICPVAEYANGPLYGLSPNINSEGLPHD